MYAPAMIACNLALEPLTYAGTVAAIVAFTILLLAITNLLMLNVRDIFAALVVAFVPFMAAMLPAARLRAPRQFGPIRESPGNLCKRSTAWWAREDSNLQPDRYDGAFQSSDAERPLLPSAFGI